LYLLHSSLPFLSLFRGSDLNHVAQRRTLRLEVKARLNAFAEHFSCMIFTVRSDSILFEPVPACTGRNDRAVSEVIA